MSFTDTDLARQHQLARLDEAERSRRAGNAAAARRWQRRSVRLSHKAQRATRQAERAAAQARLALSRVI